MANFDLLIAYLKEKNDKTDQLFHFVIGIERKSFSFVTTFFYFIISPDFHNSFFL